MRRRAKTPARQQRMATAAPTAIAAIVAVSPDARSDEDSAPTPRCAGDDGGSCGRGEGGTSGGGDGAANATDS
eukprot:7390407-Prymnesium_polylepis.1